MNDHDPKKNKIVLITYRLDYIQAFKPAEEIFFHIFMEKNNMTYEKIEHKCSKIQGFFGKLPVLYFNGMIITNSEFILFLKDFMVINFNKLKMNSHNNSMIKYELENKIDIFEEIFEKLHFYMKIQMSSINEYQFYLKNLEKYEKLEGKSLFQKLKGLFFSSKNAIYESLQQKLLNTLPGQIRLNKINDTCGKKIQENLKDTYKKIGEIIKFLESNKSLDYDQVLFLNIFIYAFLQEDEILNIKSSKLDINSLHSHLAEEKRKIFTKISQVEAKFSFKLNEKLINSSEINMDIIKDHSQGVSKRDAKTPCQDIQVIQSNNSYYHQLFTIGIFCSFTLLIYFLSKRKQKKIIN
jgi:hypothetical protein